MRLTADAVADALAVGPRDAVTVRQALLDLADMMERKSSGALVPWAEGYPRRLL